MYLSVVVPCFNEEHSLPRLYGALAEVMSGLGAACEMIVVDDGSSDGTLAEARAIATADDTVQYIALSRNFGKEAAMLAGLRHARGERIAIMDADLQHPPGMLPEMLALLERGGYDQVVARRTRHGEGALRRGLSRLYYRLVNWLSDIRVEDGAGDFRVLSRRAADALVSMGEYNRFSKGLYSWIGFQTATLPYRNVVRENGRSAWNFVRLVNYGIDGLISFSTRPLRASIYLGSMVTVLALSYVVIVVANALTSGVDVPGYATLMAGVAGLGGLHMVLLGIMGEYLGRIYAESKQRPHYLIRETTIPQVPSCAGVLPGLGRTVLAGQCDG